MANNTQFPNGVGADSTNYIDTTGLTTALSTVTGVVQAPVAIADADYTVLAANSGAIHLVANVSADRTFTLPTAAAGLRYEFWSTLIAADGHDWIIQAADSANFFLGGFTFHDSDAADGIPLLAVPDGSSDHITQINLPSVNTRLQFVCDGTNWYISGFVFSTTICTFT